MSCAKDEWADLNDVYVVYDVFLRNHLMRVALIVPALKILVALMFLTAIISLAC